MYIDIKQMQMVGFFNSFMFIYFTFFILPIFL